MAGYLAMQILKGNLTYAKVMSKFSNNIHTKHDRPEGTWVY